MADSTRGIYDLQAHTTCHDGCGVMRGAGFVVGGMIAGFAGGWFAGRGDSAPTAVPVAVHAPGLANGPPPLAEGITSLDSLTLRAQQNLYDGFPAVNPDGTANVVVEIPAGTNAKWEVSTDGLLRLEVRDGVPRVVSYLPYPGNYGMIPNTWLPTDRGGDGDALDVIVLGPALPRGSVVAVRLVGTMQLLDNGEQDDKLLAVMDGTPLAMVQSLADLERAAPGSAALLRLWFTNYKGPGQMVFQGWGEAADAVALLHHAIAAAGRATRE